MRLFLGNGRHPAPSSHFVRWRAADRYAKYSIGGATEDVYGIRNQNLDFAMSLYGNASFFLSFFLTITKQVLTNLHSIVEVIKGIGARRDLKAYSHDRIQTSLLQTQANVVDVEGGIRNQACLEKKILHWRWVGGGKCLPPLYSKELTYSTWGNYSLDWIWLSSKFLQWCCPCSWGRKGTKTWYPINF